MLASERRYKDHWEQFQKRHALVGMGLAALISAIVLCSTKDGFSLDRLAIQTIVTMLGVIAGALVAHYRAKIEPSDLTDWQIAMLPKNTILPFNPELIEPDSYDVTLGDEFLQILPDGTTKTVRTDELVVKPGECWLAHTQETFSFPNNVKGILQGKSSWARLSLFVECAGLFDKGFKGTAVLELYNAGTWGVRIKKGDRIAQMSFHRTLPACSPYGDSARNSHYQEQEGAHASWLTKHERVVSQIQS